MIIDSFDNSTPAKINPVPKKERLKRDLCIITFSHKIEKFVLDTYGGVKVGELHCASGSTDVYDLCIEPSVHCLFFRTYVGAPITVGYIEDFSIDFDCKKFILFGGAGCLDKEIAMGRIMIPTSAYRDEGTSYHYAPPADYITVTNSRRVAQYMFDQQIPYVLGKTWTTDAFYRETERNIAKRKDDGCISVEMEGAAVQALCDFRGYELYMFFASGDLLDAEDWLPRDYSNGKGGQHDPALFWIARGLARDIIING